MKMGRPPTHMKFLLTTVATALAAGSILSACTSAGSSGGSGGSSGSIGGSGGHGSGGVNGTGGGSSQGGSGLSGAGGAGGAVGAGGSSAGGGGAGGTTSTGFCPADHIFCTDFEEAAGLPTGAVMAAPDETNIAFGTPDFMILDSVSPFAGQRSLKVTSPGAFHYRMVGVTVPANFWVRLYMKSDQDIGQPDHNAFFAAMANPDYHRGTGVELAEQFSCLLLNNQDALFPTGTACGAATALPKNVWHCVVAHYDGTTGNVQVFAEQTQIINAVAWPNAMATFNTFEFGYANYHAPAASVWYDNIAITTSPLSCP